MFRGLPNYGGANFQKWLFSHFLTNCFVSKWGRDWPNVLSTLEGCIITKGGACNAGCLHSLGENRLIFRFIRSPLLHTDISGHLHEKSILQHRRRLSGFNMDHVGTCCLPWRRESCRIVDTFLSAFEFSRGSARTRFAFCGRAVTAHEYIEGCRIHCWKVCFFSFILCVGLPVCQLLYMGNVYLALCYQFMLVGNT